jgi:hypothetical protein
MLKGTENNTSQTQLKVKIRHQNQKISNPPLPNGKLLPWIQNMAMHPKVKGHKSLKESMHLNPSVLYAVHGTPAVSVTCCHMTYMARSLQR